MIDARFMQVWGQIGAHVHDISVSALALAVAALGAVLLMELRSVLRLRHVVDGQLARIFEQLDLLSFETQQLLEVQQSAQSRAGRIEAVAVAGAMPSAGATPSPVRAAEGPAPASPLTVPGRVYQNAAVLAASGASSREIAERLGLASGEARLLSSLAQARARRAEGASA